MSTDSPTYLAPGQLAAWLNEPIDGTLMEHLGTRAVEVGPQRAVAELDDQPGRASPHRIQ